MILAFSDPTPWLQHARPPVAAVLLVALWTAESVVPMFLGRHRRVSHYAHNLGLAIFNAALLMGLGYLFEGATEWAYTQSFGLLNLTPLPTGIHWVAAIVGIDVWQYAWHRLNHRLPFLWRFHAVHHADAEMDASSGLRFHTVEMLLSFLVRLAIVPLLGITLPELLLYEVISLPVILFQHSNVRISARLDQCLRWLIATPRMHYVHHSRLRAETDSNYTSLLSVWDRLFGSFQLRSKPEEISLGLEGYDESEWRRLSGMLLAPFKRHRGGE